jgi:undecaprenyl-diphosphatase
MYLQSWDIQLLQYINNGRYPLYDPFFKFITDSATPVSIIIPVTLLAWGYFLKNKTVMLAGIYNALIFLLTSITGTIIKYSINRPRPFITYDFIQKASSGGSPSFPSGHTTDAFVTAAALSLVFRKWYVIIPVYSWALLVAYSRMDLGVHYPSDVLAGICLGTGMAIMGYRIFKNLNPLK